MESLKEQILLLVSTPLYLFIICLEILLSNYRHRKLYSFKDSLNNIYLMLLNGAIDLLFRGAICLFFSSATTTTGYRSRMSSPTGSCCCWLKTSYTIGCIAGITRSACSGLCTSPITLPKK